MDEEKAKEEIRKLIEAYNSRKSEYDKLQELDIRHKLIDKLFKRLGWDLDGDENPGEVVREEGVKNEHSEKKKADYVFRLNGFPEFVVEAKAIKGVDMDDEKFKKQAIGYAYNLACSWAVLTNFLRIDIFYVDRDDTSPIRKVVDLSDLSNFDKNFEHIWLLSKESARNNYLEREAEMLGIRRTREKVGKQLYEDLKNWRTNLTDSIREKYDGKYKSYETEEIVQKIIDRLIFIRKLEDLEIEQRQLDSLTRKSSISTKYYFELKNIFKYYRDKYDSGLFGSEDEQECDLIDVENNAIREVLLGMHKPEGRKIEYNFAVIDADVLGNIYEQYLSFILKENSQLEGGRAHRKEQGIYYTPTYIVDYIVKNTIGEYVKHKELEDILKIKILDPACGSGSFLIRAFSEMCRVVKEKLEKGERLKNGSLSDYEGRLTLPQKITILLACVHGVDLDEKAVEIARLNLLLKLFEGETSETISRLKNTKKILPVLNENIMCGNSLIDDKEIAGEKAFNWSEKFKEIINYDNKDNLKEGYGFDIVIGNPPYVNIFNIKDPERSYFQDSYKTATNKSDLYAFFIEKALTKLQKERGYLGFIVSNTWTSIQSFENLRKMILNNTRIEKIVPLNLGIFSDATVVPIILIVRQTSNEDLILENNIQIIKFENNQFVLKKEIPQKMFLESKGNVFSFSRDSGSKSIFDKIKNDSLLLGDVASLSLGIKSADNKKFVSLSKRDENSKRVIKGKYIKRYKFEYRNEWIWYKPQEMMKRKGAGPRKKECFEVPQKIILQEISGDKIIATIDTEKYFALDTVNLLYKLEKGYDMRYVLGLLNCKLINFWYGSQFKGIHVKLNELRQIPIKKIFYIQIQL